MAGRGMPGRPVKNLAVKRNSLGILASHLQRHSLCVLLIDFGHTCPLKFGTHLAAIIPAPIAPRVASTHSPAAQYGARLTGKALPTPGTSCRHRQ
ncbi:hypothetical protein SDC9_203302 [bioreactor metagenome]|uniref:Uncharacterized protein n=1 Tax=bioreactor metagenome TaxID=1076179 RepID=A0A645IW28_9ZZZZ